MTDAWRDPTPEERRELEELLTAAVAMRGIVGVGEAMTAAGYGRLWWGAVALAYAEAARARESAPVRTRE